jgi:hypothetical protein
MQPAQLFLDPRGSSEMLLAQQRLVALGGDRAGATALTRMPRGP